MKRWIMNFSWIISGGKYPTGDIIGENVESSERAALVLLSHFRLEHRAEEFLPEEVGCMSPEYLVGLENGLFDND